VNYDAILFDFDGTLVDSEPIHYECWQDLLTPFGISLTWDEYARNCIGVSDRAMIRQLAAEVGVDFEALYAQYPVKKELLRDRMLAAPPMTDSVREFLLGFDQLPIGLVTSSYRIEVEPVLEALSVKHRFVASVFGDEVKNLKPHPEPYLLAAERLGVKRPLVFEDSEAGLASARAAGFTAVRVEHPADLPSLLGSKLLLS
jgi:HAD superfamily hydrolase (TIGR01509 family)